MTGVDSVFTSSRFMILCECYYSKILNQNSAEGNGMVKQIEQFLKRKYDDFIR